jgi:hypothetical protein
MQWEITIIKELSRADSKEGTHAKSSLGNAAGGLLSPPQ